MKKAKKILAVIISFALIFSGSGLSWTLADTGLNENTALPGQLSTGETVYSEPDNPVAPGVSKDVYTEPVIEPTKTGGTTGPTVENNIYIEQEILKVQEVSNLPYVLGELIIKFKSGKNSDKVAGKYGLKVSKKIGKLGIGKVRLTEGADLKAEMAKLKKDSEIAYVEPNYYFTVDMTPNDPSYNDQWGIPKIKADQAWDTTTGSTSVIIAVVDTGVDADHPDLTANLVAGYNTINNTNNTDDDNGHGTHVAGIAAGRINNNLGVAGMAGTSKIMPVKAMGSTGQGSTTDISEGITWAVDNGAKVINLSLGTSTYVQTMQDAIDYAYNNGAIVIAAAGNENTSALRYPAAMNHVVAVSATTETNTKAIFSNYGTHIDVAAPGTNILSTTFDGSYGYKQGTSMATPYVAGVAALVLSQRPALTPGQLEKVLQISATDIGTAGKDNYFGYGLVDALEALTEPVDTSPVGLTLIGDSPDPFGPTGSTYTKITYSIPVNAKLTLRVYDSSNNLVKNVLYASAQTAGTRYATWNGKNTANVIVPGGTYTYKIQAEDYSGNLSSELSGTIDVDRTNPVISGVAVSDDPFAPDGNASTTISYNLSETCKTTVKIYNSSNVLINTIANAVSQSSGNNSVSWNGKDSKGVIVGDGTYTIKIDAVDNANWKAVQQTKTMAIERNNPTITLVSDSPDPLKATGTSINTIKYTLSENANVVIGIYDTGNNLIKTLVNGPVTAGAKSITWNGKNTAGALVPDGTYTYKINATDPFGKFATQVTGTITTDKTIPVVNGLSDSPDPLTTSGTVTVDYTLSETAKTSISILNSSNAVVKTLQSNILKNAGANSITWDGRNSAGVLVGDGIYTYKITAVDLVGWASVPVTGTITVERANPAITAVSDTPDPFKPTGTTLSTIKYTLSENANVVIKIYNSSNVLVKTLVNGQITAGAKSVTWNGKNDSNVLVSTGTYTYKIDATDSSGKIASQVIGTIAIDTTAPVIASDTASPNPFNPTGGNTATISYTISENCKMTVAIYSSSNVLVRTLYSNISKVQGANTATWNGTNTKNLLVAAGTYKYVITAVDSVGLKTIKEGNITVN